MIQRVQSVWLFLASLALFLLLILPILNLGTGSTELTLQVGGLYQKAGTISEKIESYTIPFALTILAAILCISTIFLYRNRTLQKRIIILIAFLIGFSAGFVAYSATHITGGINGASVAAGAFMPLLSLVFCILAFRGIRNDEQLIRSADRLR